MNSEKLNDLKNWAALILAWTAVFPALILFLNVWFAGRTRTKGLFGPLTNLMAMFLAMMVFLMVNRISKLFYNIPDPNNLKKAFLMAITLTLTGISLPSTTSTYAQQSDSFLMAFSFMVMAYSALSVLWRRFNEAAEKLRTKML